MKIGKHAIRTWLRLVSCSLLWIAGANAQIGGGLSQTAASTLSPITPNTLAQASISAIRKQNLALSLAAFGVGNYSGAESVLVGSVVGISGTADYEYQLGGQLGTAARLLLDLKQIAAAKQAAAQALVHLDITRLPLVTGSATLQGQALELAGILNEQVMGDLPTALSCYTKAVQSDPRRNLAKSGADRVTNILQILGGHK